MGIESGSDSLRGTLACNTDDLSPSTLIDISLNDPFVPAKLEKALSPRSQRTSGPQGSVQPFTLIRDPAAWTMADWAGKDDWIYQLTGQDLAELDAAVAEVQARGVRQTGNAYHVQEVVKSQADFLLPTLGPKLVAIRENVRIGRGFQLIRGVPVDRLTRQQIMIVYWGMGQYWGNANVQNAKAHLIGHIKDLRQSVNNTTRVYTTNLAQPFHNDISDIVGLLCLQKAPKGGLSSWSSSLQVVNEMLLRGRQDLVQELAGPNWYLDRKGEVPAGEKPYFRLPILNYHQGYLSINYSATYYELAQRHPDVPRMTPKQKEAVRWFNALAKSDELRMDGDLQPGDIQLLQNHGILHMRTAFEDSIEQDQRRHLLRLWISPPNDRQLPDVYSPLWGSVTPGQRGGIWGFDAAPTIPLEAE